MVWASLCTQMPAWVGEGDDAPLDKKQGHNNHNISEF